MISREYYGTGGDDEEIIYQGQAAQILSTSNDRCGTRAALRRMWSGLPTSNKWCGRQTIQEAIIAEASNKWRSTATRDARGNDASIGNRPSASGVWWWNRTNYDLQMVISEWRWGWSYFIKLGQVLVMDRNVNKPKSYLRASSPMRPHWHPFEFHELICVHQPAHHPTLVINEQYWRSPVKS